MPLHLTKKVAVTTVRHGCFLIHLDLSLLLFFSFFFGVSELMPAYLNLAFVRFNVKGHLDSCRFGVISHCVWQEAVTVHKHVIMMDSMENSTDRA